MSYRLRFTNIRAAPAREGERAFDVLADFLAAARDVLADMWNEGVSATLPDGRVLDRLALDAFVRRGG